MPDPPAATSDADAELDQQLEPIADELYALKPDEFSAARDERIRAAKAEGKPALARELGKLRKPTLSAWLINLLWRDQREVIEQLFELAGELNRAQAEASGSALRELMGQRRQIESALLRRASALAQYAGVKVTDGVVREAQETLTAALAQPDVADEVRTGRLVKPAEYAGFGGAGTPSSAPRPSPTAAPRQPPAEPINLQEAVEKRRAEERRAAERKVEDARARAEVASRTLAENERAAESAHTRHDDLRRQSDELRDRQRRLERDIDEAERAAADADRERERARTARADAQDALDQAERTLREL